MCNEQETSRRDVLTRIAGLGLVLPLVGTAAFGKERKESSPPLIHRRAEWGKGFPPKGPMEAEDPRDVRFLLVHHTATSNDYARKDVVPMIQEIYRLHTGPEKGWPDIAYNFLIDRYGGIWEARAGSIDKPMKGDATGGSQGFALLASLIGNHEEEPPTAEALSSLIGLLALLAQRYEINPSVGATTSFVSRGSNKWPVGERVTTGTIAGHRDMSQTLCPGEFVYPLLKRRIPTSVQKTIASWRSTPSTPTPSPTDSSKGEVGDKPDSSTPPRASAESEGGETDASDVLRRVLVGVTGAVVAGVAIIAAILGRENHQSEQRANRMDRR